MRMWEVEDNRAIPSNLVLEQDFVLRIRRLHRLGTPHLIVNLMLAAIGADKGGRGPIEEAQQRLQTFANSRHGSYAEMSNGDIFLVWQEKDITRDLPNQALNVAMPFGPAAGEAEKFMSVYSLPLDYPSLRERANQYIEMNRAAAASADETTASQLLQTEAARGPLTAWSVNQIERLLGDIDLKRYIRTQPIYERQPNGFWTPVFEECFIGFDELRRAHFPRLDTSVPDHLFLELCQALDRRLLAGLTQHFEMIDGQALSLNLSIPSVMGSTFAQFAYRVPRIDHSHICFELHRGDLLQDYALTVDAISVLHKEGFKVAIDSVSPDILPFVNLGLLDVDYIKLNVAKDRAHLLTDKKIITALSALAREKLILFHCDSREAFEIGVKMGIRLYQGWLIDDLVKEKANPDSRA